MVETILIGATMAVFEKRCRRKGRNVPFVSLNFPKDGCFYQSCLPIQLF